MMGSIFCNHKNEKTSPLCLLGDFCWKWWTQLSQSSSDISEVSYCGTSSGWANVGGNAQDHQVDKQQCSTNEWHLKWPLLSCYTRHVLCWLQTERWKICFIDKPGERIMILRGKSTSHTQAVPLLIPLPFYWQTSAIAEPGEMTGKWVLFLEVYELSPFKIAEKWNGCKSWQSNVNREFRWLEKSIRRAPSSDARAISKTGKSERELVWTENV